MDPFTHGVAGALIAKAILPAPSRSSSPASARPAAGKWTSPLHQGVGIVTLGALFPDVDVIFKFFSDSPVGTLEYHRWITHSLVCLPAFAVALAWGTQAAISWWEARQSDSARANELGSSRMENAELSFSRMALLFGIGILSHIFLDAITSWGTMMWAPLRDTRVNWDWVFIIDGTLTSLMLVPQLLSWIYSDSARMPRRRLTLWLVLSAAAILLQQVSSLVGATFSYPALVAVLIVIAVALFVPERKDWGTRTTRRQWAQAGLWVTATYLLVCLAAQRVALARVEEFAQRENLKPQRVGALPLPPAFTRWVGLVRTSAGVYQGNFSLLDPGRPKFEFVADRATPETLEAATSLRAVQTYLWFARFPVVETREVSGQQVVVFTDHRFVQRWASAPAPFEYWVVLDVRGNVVRQGWAQQLLAERD